MTMCSGVCKRTAVRSTVFMTVLRLYGYRISSFPGLPSRGHPSSRTLKPRLRYKLDHRVVGEVYYNLYTRGARPGRVVCLSCSFVYNSMRTTSVQLKIANPQHFTCSSL